MNETPSENRPETAKTSRVHRSETTRRTVVGAKAGDSRVPRKLLKWTLPVVITVVAGMLLGAIVAATIQVPEVDAIADYTPNLVTELVDRNGRVYKEYFKENRDLLEEGELPEALRHALFASEDRNFLEHGGIDAVGIARAAISNFSRGEVTEGASTLTMQLAGGLLLDRRQRTWKRKISEAFRAVDLEKQLSKEQILTLYANWVNLGHGYYGFQAASRFYFDRSVDELTVEQAALLVAIIKRPADRSPIRRPEYMLERRNVVLRTMRDEGYLDEQQYQEAIARPLGVKERRRQPQEAAYFAEEVRRYLYERYGENDLYERGLRVTTTLDQRIQAAAEESLRWGLQHIDHRRGWRGAPRHLDEEALDGTPLEELQLASWTDDPLLPGQWIEGIVQSVDRRQATVRVGERVFELGSDEVSWREGGARLPSSLLNRGDVALFEVRAREQPTDEGEEEEPAEDGETASDDATDSEDTQEAGEDSDAEAAPPPDLYLQLVQEPEIEGAVLVVELGTGAVRALVGGWDYERNEFNRATQAMRQVGSAFKPVIFGAAYEQGYTPADTLFDAPAVFRGATEDDVYSPRNFYRKYAGIVTLRAALERSLNVSAVKLQDLVGVDNVIDFARRSGITAPLPPYPSLALGVAEITPLELTAAYAAIGNQGIYVEPYLIERVETLDGRALEQHRARTLQATDAKIAYLLTHTLRGVTQRGTAISLAGLPVAIAGKTGTTDDYTDAWFAGFTPDYAITVWVGFDKKRSLGRNMTGAEAALPIWKRILEAGLEEGWIDRGEDFQQPPGVTFRWVERYTGLIAGPHASRRIHEAFLTGTEPVQEYSLRWQRILELPWYQQRPFYGKPKAGEKMPEDIGSARAVLNAAGQ